MNRQRNQYRLEDLLLSYRDWKLSLVEVYMRYLEFRQGHICRMHWIGRGVCRTFVIHLGRLELKIPLADDKLGA